MSVEYDNNNPIDSPTDMEVRAIRTEYDETVLSRRGANREKKFHLPLDPDGESTKTLCSKVSGVHSKTIDFRRASLSSFPFNWHGWCKDCVQLWRRGVTGDG